MYGAAAALPSGLGSHLGVPSRGPLWQSLFGGGPIGGVPLWESKLGVPLGLANSEEGVSRTIILATHHCVVVDLIVGRWDRQVPAAGVGVQGEPPRQRGRPPRVAGPGSARESETVRQTQTQRHRHRQSDTQETQTATARDRETETVTERDRDGDRARQRQRQSK